MGRVASGSASGVKSECQIKYVDLHVGLGRAQSANEQKIRCGNPQSWGVADRKKIYEPIQLYLNAVAT